MKYNIYFSPTGNTEKLVKYIGKKFDAKKDIDLSNIDIDNYTFNSDDFCIFGIPSFGGRVPKTLVERLKKLKGNKTPSFLLVTYGGRAYDDTLKELQYILEENNFSCLFFAAIVTEHSIVPEIGKNRPNEEDYKELDRYIEKVKDMKNTRIEKISIPGNIPFKEYNVLGMDIEVSDACVKCGICARKCPVQAISHENPNLTDKDKCISCMRCVYVCPFKARRANQEKVNMLFNKLKTIYKDSMKSEFF